MEASDEDWRGMRAQLKGQLKAAKLDYSRALEI